MFGLGPATKIYVALGATDMRKGFDGLYGLARGSPWVPPHCLYGGKQRRKPAILCFDFIDHHHAWLLGHSLAFGAHKYREHRYGQRKGACRRRRVDRSGVSDVQDKV